MSYLRISGTGKKHTAPQSMVLTIKKWKFVSVGTVLKHTTTYTMQIAAVISGDLFINSIYFLSISVLLFRISGICKGKSYKI